MNQNFSILFLFCLLLFPSILFGKNNQTTADQESGSFVYKKLVTPNSSVEAEALYRYLQNIFGEKILSGQMSATWGIDEMEYIRNVTGKQPALRGIDLIHNNDNKSELQIARDWWEAGGIPVVMWHWGTQSLSADTKNTNKIMNIERYFIDGTSENKAMWSEFKSKADQLEVLRDNNVPVLWCPLYELSGNQLGLAKQDAVSFKKLWQTMFNYFVGERKLNNLIWVFGFSSDPDITWYPGNNYVDITGASIYEGKTDPHKKTFIQLSEITGDIRMPLSFQVCSTIPNLDKCSKEGAMWSWWMQWHTSDLSKMDKSYLKEIYNHNLVITLNQVPNIVEEYSTDLVKREFNAGRTIPFNELKGFNIGLKPQADNVSIINEKIKIVVGGADIWGKKDQGYFAFTQFDGDFDISVQVHSLFEAHLYTKAGIMARVDLSKNSKHVFFQVFPNNSNRNNNSGGCEFQYRPEKAQETKAIYPDPATAENKYDVNFPNTWIRLTRRGNIFKSYISNDNVNWHIYAKHKQKMPNKLLLGLAVTSHDLQNKTIAEFSDLFITWQR